MAGPAGEGPGAARPLRADARRNRDAIVQAARDVFDRDGVLAPLDGVAVRAGVGNATLYRNFPTRDDLLTAVIADSITAALADAEDLEGSLPPAEALAEWLVLLTWRLRVWHDLPDCLATARTTPDSPVQTACTPLRERLATALERVRTVGAGAAEIDADELWELVLALSWAVDRFGDDEATARRRVRTATAGVLR